MTDLTRTFNTVDWNNLSSEQITSLFLFGTLTPPSDLNDRIRPLVSADQQETYE